MGYPAFYENVAENGLTFTSLLFDYADYLYHDEGGVEDCCLSAPNMLGNLFDSPGQKTEVLKKAGGIVKAMRERRSDIPAESQEALTLRASCELLWMVRDFARPCNPGTGDDPIGDPHTLEFAISHFTKLRQTLSPIEPDARGDLEEHIDWAIRACQSQLGATGRTCSEASSPAPTQSEEHDTPSDAGGEPRAQTTAGITCYNHPGRPVVATCSQGCGRWLCQECAGRYEPPACEECAKRVFGEQRKALRESRTRIIGRMAVNAGFLVPYIFILAHAGDLKPPMWPVVLVLLWGFVGFRWLLNAFTSLTGLIIFAGLRTWGIAFLVGSLLVGLFGFLVIPFLLIADLVRLLRTR
ncbi:MAG TPA: hypothetical protein VM182_14125 [Terriglobia bacterium]|nr:hypothetical protein [Terriglobia bacterium]